MGVRDHGRELDRVGPPGVRGGGPEPTGRCAGGAATDCSIRGCGAFAFTYDGADRGDPDLGATIGAVPGLLGIAFPFQGGIDGPAPATPRCTG